MGNVFTRRKQKIEVIKKIAQTVGKERVCPSCGYKTIAGMSGSIHATCKQCGYKDPCCYD